MTTFEINVRPPRRIGRERRIAIGVFAALVCGACTGPAEGAPSTSWATPVSVGPVEGRLRATRIDPGDGACVDPEVQRRSFTSGEDGIEVEDNDLRGFLDGGFKWGWNQPGQQHVRVGRRGESPQYGEHELFRVLHRWELELPSVVAPDSVRLHVPVEKGPDERLQVFLYAVRKDWNPGSGGVGRDNTSPPATGEVWWKDVGFGTESWSLPGVSHAGWDEGADLHPVALAMAVYEPGTETLTFASKRLSEYADVRLDRNEPLLFLLKLSDYEEDQPGSLLYLFSVNHGDSWNDAVRPRMEVFWTACGQTLLDTALLLEYGRSLVFPASELTPGAVAVTLDGQTSPAHASLEVRGGREAADTSAWQRADVLIDRPWSWLQVRVTAAGRPLPLGRTFQALLTETWIQGTPAAEQDVVWSFVSPTGRGFEVLGDYRGDYQWAIDFVPDEIGPWRYRVEHALGGEPYRSNVVRVDVVPRDWSGIPSALAGLARSVSGDSIPPSGFVRFNRLERAAVNTLVGEGSGPDHADAVRRALRAVRELLSTSPVPEVYPFEASSRPGR